MCNPQVADPYQGQQYRCHDNHRNKRRNQNQYSLSDILEIMGLIDKMNQHLKTNKC